MMESAVSCPLKARLAKRTKMRRVCISMHQHVPRAVEIELDATAVAAAAMMNCGSVQAAISNSEFNIKQENSSLTVAG